MLFVQSDKVLGSDRRDFQCFCTKDFGSDRQDFSASVPRGLTPTGEITHGLVYV